MSQFAFNPYKTEQKPTDNIDQERFFEWTKNSFYRTNYGTMTSKVRNNNIRTKINRKKKRLWDTQDLFLG